MGPERSTSTTASASVLAIAVIGLLLALLPACGVPGETDARVVPTDQVPGDLLRPAPTEPPTTTTTLPTGVDITLYFLDGNQLTPVERRVPESPSLSAVMKRLEAGPTADEADAGLRSALAGNEPLVKKVALQRGVAMVDLAQGFTALPPSDQVLAIGQIVYTATARPGVGRAAFTLEGEPVGVPRGDGSVTTEPVAREDYVALTTTTTAG